MKEESQLDAMRAAIRGDFDRLAQRRGAQELMRVEEEGEPGDRSEVAERAAHGERGQQPAESSRDPGPRTDAGPGPETPESAGEAVETPGAAPAPEGELEPPAPLSWLARLLGRS
jgi:hypothetical protein